MMKDRSHYGTVVDERVRSVTPEQAHKWLNTGPAPPIMWSKASTDPDRVARYAADMLAGRWDNTRDDIEPVMIAVEGYVLGGRHRLTAVCQLNRPVDLLVRFYEKPAKVKV